jgi:hypothetical protein
MSQSISVIEPLRRAMDTTRRLLFAPFDLVKWLGLGFTAWLAMLGEGGGGANFGNSFGSPHHSPVMKEAWAWTAAHLALVIAIVLCVGVVILAISLAVSWVSSRGKFMFLDNVVHNRAEIVAPWNQYRVQGNSYFLFSIGIGLVALAVLAVILLLSGLIAMPDITHRHFGAYAISAIILGGVLFLLYLIVLSCLLTFLEDFIVPIMALRSCRALAAWREFFVLFKAQAGMCLLYLLFKMVLGWAVAAITLVLCCCLCCLVVLPYLGTVLILPLLVFLRCYSLHFLEQFGDQYRLFRQQDSREYLAVAQEPS